MYLELDPAGGKWWRLKYRFRGIEKKLSFGVYPAVSLKMAREKRDEARKLIAAGVDPSAHRKAAKRAAIERSENTLESLAREWLSNRSTRWSESTRKRTESRLSFDLFPALGSAAVADLEARDLLSVLRRVESRTPETAHRLLRDLGQIFRFGISVGVCGRNPAADLRGALQPLESGHFSATLEPQRLGIILRHMDAYPGTATVSSALKLMPMFFVRPGELRHAEWQHIDLNAAEWRYTASKTKNEKGVPTQHIVPLSTQAVAVLRDLRRVTGFGRFCFPSARGGDRPMSDNALLVAMRSVEIRKEEMTGHGFRAVARTLLDEVLGFRPDIIEHQLGHAVRDPNGRAYNRTTFLPERRQMMQTWSDYLDQLKVKAVETVLPFRASA